MNEQMRRQYLEAMGVDVWLSRSPIQAEVTPLDLTGAVTAPVSVGSTVQSTAQPRTSNPEEVALWQDLSREVRSCQACVLSEQRTQAVFGSGDRDADWLIVGEAPGQEEDKQGEPFVDTSGLLLNDMLFALGLKREQVFVTNVVKCRPAQKRDLRTDEIASCANYLRRQVDLVKPKIILLLGRVAAQSILSSTANIGDMRGSTHYFPDTKIPMVIAYHPAYLIRKPLDKRKMWQDLQYAYRVYSQGEG